MSSPTPKSVAALASAALSLSLLTGCDAETDNIKDAPTQDTVIPQIMTVTPDMVAALNKGCTFYTNLMEFADTKHFSGKTAVSQQEIARKAHQNMLQKGFDPVEHSGSNELIYEEDTKEISGLKLGETTITLPEATDQIASYKDHCAYFQDAAITLSQETGTDIFRLYEYAADGAIRASRDPHSTYEWRERAENTRAQTQGEFGGLGIEVRMTDGVVEVVSPLSGTPAEEAGILAGDRITHLDGAPVAGKTLDHAVDIMRGAPGKSITLTIKRGNNPAFDMNITRDIIKIEVVKAKLVGEDQDTAHIEIKTFNAKTSGEVIKSIEEFMQQQEAGMIRELNTLVLDFRNNPGGLLFEAEILADIFLQAKAGEKNIIVAVGKNENDGIVRMDTRSRENFSGFKIKVLINGGSASASEIVAGALKDAGIEVIGTNSYGKGSVQTFFPIDDQGHRNWANDIGSLRLTTQLFFPGNSGLSNYKSGIIPNMMVRFNDARDEVASKPSGESVLDSGSLVPAEKTRAGNVPDTLCSVKAEFAGALPAETLKTLPGELVTNFRMEDAQTGEWQSVKGIDAALACALKTPHVSISPYTP